MHRAFALADVIEVPAESRRMSTMPFFGLSVGGAPSPMMGSYGSATVPDILGDVPQEQPAVLKVAKVGLLWRKGETNNLLFTYAF